MKAEGKTPITLYLKAAAMSAAIVVTMLGAVSAVNYLIAFLHLSKVTVVLWAGFCLMFFGIFTMILESLKSKQRRARDAETNGWASSRGISGENDL